jgi:hypothetical protein
MGLSEPAVPSGEVSSPPPSEEMVKNENQLRVGANWFYWIAGLTLVNTAMQMMGSDHGFILGLGLTQIIDAVAQGVGEKASSGAGTVIHVLGLLMDGAIVGFFALMGWLAGKRRGWAFVLGMIAYGLDAPLCALVELWFSVLFHVFALFGIWNGYRALRRLRAMQTPSTFGAPARPITPGGR